MLWDVLKLWVSKCAEFDGRGDAPDHEPMLPRTEWTRRVFAEQSTCTKHFFCHLVDIVDELVVPRVDGLKLLTRPIKVRVAVRRIFLVKEVAKSLQCPLITSLMREGGEIARWQWPVLMKLLKPQHVTVFERQSLAGSSTDDAGAAAQRINERLTQRPSAGFPLAAPLQG